MKKVFFKKNKTGGHRSAVKHEDFFKASHRIALDAELFFRKKA